MRMKIHTQFLSLLLFPVIAHAQYTNTSYVLDGSGSISSGGSLVNISAAGQPGGIKQSTGSDIVNQAGFLNTFALKENLDTDGDGLINEVDVDNDNDQLTDTDEISGASFSPATSTDVNLADSDGDGMSDGQESIAGTDPVNINALLEIIAIQNNLGTQEVTWVARGNDENTYVLRYAGDSYAQPTLIVFSNTISGGTAPWFVVTNTYSFADPTNARFFAVETFR